VIFSSGLPVFEPNYIAIDKTIFAALTKKKFLASKYNVKLVVLFFLFGNLEPNYEMYVLLNA